MVRRSLVTTLFVVATSVPKASPAGAVQRETCMGAAESAQELRRQGKLRLAREQLAVCSQKGCPSFVRRDCSTWLSDLERAMPSAELVARDPSGRPLADVRVLLDGTVVATSLAKPEAAFVELDPGPHVFRFERLDGSFAEVKQTFGEGERTRVVATLVPRSAPATPPAPVVLERPVPAAAWVFGGVSALAVGSFGVFAALGASEYGALERTCKPRCTSAELDPVESKFLIANVSLGVAAAALGVAAVFYFSRPNVAATARLDLRPLPGGGAATVGASF